MSFPCLKCSEEVTSRQEALLCELCDRWCHRKCGTGITRQEYRAAIREEREIEWTCEHCHVECTPAKPLYQSTPIHETNEDMNEDSYNSYALQSENQSCSMSDLSAHSSSSDHSTASSGSYSESNECTPDELRLEAMLEQSEHDDSHVRDSSPVPMPSIVEEPSIAMPSPPKDIPVGPQVITYERVEAASRQQKTQLIDSRGYRYNMKEVTKAANGKVSTYWQCTCRTKKLYCKATVIEVGNVFRLGKYSHIHQADVGAATAAKIVADVKLKAEANIFKPASAIVDELLSINAFVRSGECAKQVPLVFVLMSGKSQNDYEKVLQMIVNLLPCQPDVTKVVLDFEQAMWGAIKTVLGPNVKRMGCVFHWTQAVWRKVQELGLTIAYTQNDATHRYIRNMLALPRNLQAKLIGHWEDYQNNRKSVYQLLKACSYLYGPVREN